MYTYIPESKSENNFSFFAAESQGQSRGKLNVIFTSEKLFKRGQLSLFIIGRLTQGASLKPILLLNRGLFYYLAGVNK